MCALPTLTSPANVAVVEIDDTGAGTLHLDGQLVEPVVAAQPRLVVRVLLDYAATAGRHLTVLTRYADGRGAVHQFHPDGTVALLRRPSTSSGSPGPPGREHQHSSERKDGPANPRDRALFATAWKRSSRWVVDHGLWLMLCAQVFLLVGSLTFIVVALAPYLSSRS